MTFNQFCCCQKKFFSAILMLSFFPILSAQNLIEYREKFQNGKCGYFNKEGNIVIEPQYERGGTFSEGIAMVQIHCCPDKIPDA